VEPFGRLRSRMRGRGTHGHPVGSFA
jgi:hypothetical protein